MSDFNYKKLTPFKWFVLENFPFIEADFDALTEWQLLCKLGKEINKIIDSENTLGLQVETMTAAYNNLKDYVDNYFENLDVQEEVNEKLNEMAENGQLSELISQYLESQAIFAFNTLEDLETATNLSDGSFVRTYGKNEYNDGKGFFYKIRTLTNQDIIDNNNIVALTNTDNLIAEKIREYKIKYTETVETLKNITYIENGDVVITKGYYSANDGGSAKYLISNINNTPNNMDKLELQNGLYATLILEYPINCKQVGAKGDGIQDDTLYLQRAIDISYCGCYIPRGTYRITDTINFENKTIIGENETWVTIKGDIEDSTKGIMKAGGICDISGITISYDSSVITSNMARDRRVGLYTYGGYRNLALQNSHIHNCQFTYCGTAIDDGGHSVFSTTFENIKINNVGRAGIYFSSIARTGNVYSNIYINNHSFISSGNPDTIQCNQGIRLEGEESECTIIQLNVEHLTAYQPIYISNVNGLKATSIHLEGVRSIGTYEGFVFIDKTFGQIDNISFYYTRHKTGQSLIKLGAVQDGNTDTDLYGGAKMLKINNLICKGLNRPDRATYGYEPEYPVSASTISSESSIKNFKFIDRESASDRYLVALYSYVWETFTYGYNDKTEYEQFSNNSHNSITWIELGAKRKTYSTANRPTTMLYDGLQIYDYTLNKPIWYNSGVWRDGTGAIV